MTHSQAIFGSRALRLPAVCDLIGTSPATVWRYVRANSGFPRPFRISPGVTAWDEGEVFRWIESKKAARGDA